MRIESKRAILAFTVLSLVGIFTATYLYLRFAVVRKQVACRNVSAAEAKAMIESDPSLLILDVSSQVEYQEAHLKGAVNIQLSDLSARMGELDRNSAILVCCRTGRRSAQACSALVERGFTKVYNMEGGVAAWIDSGYPVVTGNMVSSTSKFTIGSVAAPPSKFCRKQTDFVLDVWVCWPSFPRSALPLK